MTDSSRTREHLEPDDAIHVTTEIIGDCPYCEDGRVLVDPGLRTPMYHDRCDSCDGTGKTVRTIFERPDGSVVSVRGSAPLDEKSLAALDALAEAAVRSMSEAPDA